MDGEGGLGGAGSYSFGADDEAPPTDSARRGPPPAPPTVTTGAPAPARPQVAETTPQPQPQQAPAEAGEREPTSAGQQQVVDAGSSGPLLIYEAELHLAVHEVREKIDRVIAIADELGGYLQRQDEHVVIIRVPAARFREALGQVEEVGDVLSRRISAQDVTEQFRDTRIRLQNALQMRDRMAELLERADTVPDSLTIQRELERLTETIELLRGQLRALEDRISFSTITVRFQPVRDDPEVPRERFRLPFPWLDRLGLPHLLELR
jgi:hypothetical protein